MANLLENGAQVDARDKVRICWPMYRVALLCVMPLNFTQHNVDMGR